MTSPNDFAPWLLVSRLRRVSDAMFAGVEAICLELGVTLPARCLPILFLLRDRGRLGISELAGQLGQSHPAVSQMSRKLLTHGLVRESPDPADGRRRLFSLSPRAVALLKRLEPTWATLAAALAELDSEQGLSVALAAVDSALQRRDLASRIRQQLRQRQACAAVIVPFERRYGKEFKRLNLEWLKHYFKVEPIDKVLLSNPEALLRVGGRIFFARLGGKIVGTCALLARDADALELSKMAVTPACQGLGIGRQLVEAAIDCFHTLDRSGLYLETNSRLHPAIALYESVGFRREDRPGGPSPYARADVYMAYHRSASRASRGVGAGRADRAEVVAAPPA